MDGVAGKSKQKDGSESFSSDSVTESRKSTSCGSRLSSDNSCSAKLGWPIGKALVTNKCLKKDAFEEESKSKSNAKGGAADNDSFLKENSKFSGH